MHQDARGSFRLFSFLALESAMDLRLPGSSTRECLNTSLFRYCRLHPTQYEFRVTASDSEISYSPSSPPFMFSQIFTRKVKQSDSLHLSFIHIVFQFKSIHVVLARCLISIPRKSATPVLCVVPSPISPTASIRSQSSLP